VNTAAQLAYCWAALAAPVFGYIGHWSLDLSAIGVAVTTCWSAAHYLIGTGTFKFINDKRKKRKERKKQEKDEKIKDDDGK
jgi:hypothetical protein